MEMFPGKLYTKAEAESTEGMKMMRGICAEKLQCRRCGNTTSFGEMPCLCGKSNCKYCRRCLLMGRINECTNLYYQESPKIRPRKQRFNEWQGELSPAQEIASQRIVQAVVAKTDLLLWAVAGSGKTEMLFAGIEKALQSGERIALVSPRVDVCLELYPRLQTAFPHVAMCCLYGGSADQYQGERFVVATTHQLIRFCQAFDTIFIDEIDAFPYSLDPLLPYAVGKASKLIRTQLYITATPERSWQMECRAGLRSHIKIPARYHGYPLPVPRPIWIGNWQRSLLQNEIPPRIERWLGEMLPAGKPVLLFFPDIGRMKRSYPLFKARYQKVQYVYAEDPDRTQKVRELRRGETQLLLTTTILERGVTFPNVQVGVVGAEKSIFTESVLVQIAGRVGRKPEYPSGEICFFHAGRTLAINRAVAQIKAMNKLAEQEGMLR